MPGLEGGELGAGAVEVVLEDDRQDDAGANDGRVGAGVGIDRARAGVGQEASPEPFRRAELAALEDDVAEQQRAFVRWSRSEVAIEELPEWRGVVGLLRGREKLLRGVVDPFPVALESIERDSREQPLSDRPRCAVLLP